MGGRRFIAWVGSAALIGVGALIMWSRGVPIIPAVAFVGVLGQGSWAMLVRCRRKWPDARNALLRASVRSLRWLRQLYRANAGVAFIAPASMAVLLASALIASVLSSSAVFYTGTRIWIALLAPMGAVECAQRILRLTARAWTRTAGRLLLLGLGALVSVFSHAIASNVASYIGHVEPKYCPNFVALTTVLLTPLLYIYSLVVLMAALAIFEFMLLSMLYLVSLPMRAFAIVFDQGSRFDALIYRLVYGRRPAAGYQRELLEDGQMFTMRTLSMVACAMAIFIGLGVLAKSQEAHLGWWSRTALVAMDFQFDARCTAGGRDAYLPLEGDWITVAHRHGQALTFTRSRCQEAEVSDALPQASAKQSVRGL